MANNLSRSMAGQSLAPSNRLHKATKAVRWAPIYGCSKIRTLHRLPRIRSALASQTAGLDRHSETRLGVHESKTTGGGGELNVRVIETSQKVLGGSILTR